MVGLNFQQEAREADFRYGLVRLRENAESIAFYGGENKEMNFLIEVRTFPETHTHKCWGFRGLIGLTDHVYACQRLTNVVNNFGDLLIASRNLDFFTSFYRYLIALLPAAVIAPLYFKVEILNYMMTKCTCLSGNRCMILFLPKKTQWYLQGEIEFGVVTQSQSAFAHILGDVSLVVYQVGNRQFPGQMMINLALCACYFVTCIIVYFLSANPILVLQLESLAGFSAVVDRLGQFQEVMDKCKPDEAPEASLSSITINDEPPHSSSKDPLLALSDITLGTPESQSALIENLSLKVGSPGNAPIFFFQEKA